MINWPAMIKLAGDDELLMVSNSKQLEQQLHALKLTDDDYLIDSKGCCFDLRDGLDKADTIKQLTLDEVNLLIQSHSANEGGVCVSKTWFPSIESAIRSILTEY
ncbi:DUF4144 family protein [Vibrio nitrifigilis]|uniref:Uncharacterized protein n=1 Tax=Vibrio nitrifigilis TaxID=2789781 RepID=A0ABS0GJ47_9VIBR|nr:DUF4144 family protein [Vibrio nitrifigilis]MBF9002456.1 hypothetical protein [Vibrio nitrifigilis]